MDHRQRLQAANEAWKAKFDEEKERLKTLEESRDSELDLLAEQLENENMEMLTIHQLLSYYNRRTSSNAIGHNFRRLLRNFNRFQKLIDNGLEEMELVSGQKKLRMEPPLKLKEASSALQKFSETVQSLQDNCPEKLPFEYLVLQRKVSRKLHSIQTTFNQIFTDYEVYQKRFESFWKSFIASKKAVTEIMKVMETHCGQLKITMAELKELMKQVKKTT